MAGKVLMRVKKGMKRWEWMKYESRKINTSIKCNVRKDVYEKNNNKV